MDLFTLIGVLSKNLAWPAVVGGSVYTLRGPIGDLIRKMRALRFQNLEIETHMQQFVLAPDPDQDEHDKRQGEEQPAPAPRAIRGLARKQPYAAVMAASQGVEEALKELGHKKAKIDKTRFEGKPLDLGRKLVDKGVLQPATFTRLSSLHRIRSVLQESPGVDLPSSLSCDLVDRASRLEAMLDYKAEKDDE